MEYLDHIKKIAFYEKEKLKGREEKAAFYTNKEVSDYSPQINLWGSNN